MELPIMKLITNRIKMKSKCFTELYIRVEFVFEEYASVNPLIVKLTINTAATIVYRRLDQETTQFGCSGRKIRGSIIIQWK